MSRRMYDRISSAYRLIADRGEHATRDQGLEALGLATGETVLEIGIGTGRALVAISRSVGEAGRAYGIDLSSGMLHEARRHRPGGRLGVVCVARTELTMTRIYEWLHRHSPHIADCRPIDVPRVLQDGGYRVETQREISLWGLPVIAALARKRGSSRRATAEPWRGSAPRLSVGAALGADSDKEAMS